MTTSTRAKDVVRRNIRRLREESGRGLSDLCRTSKVSRSFWYEIESGEKECTVGKLAQIATVFGVTPADLFTEHDANGNGNGAARKRRKA